MSEAFVRHFISAIATFICLLVFFIGYKTGQFGWWWTGFLVFIVYLIVYKLIEV